METARPTLQALKAYSPRTYSSDSKKVPVANVGPDPRLRPPQLEVGQRIQGTVLAQVGAGIFKVSVAGRVVQMPLPATVRSGDKVALQVISSYPRLVFGMSASSNPLSTSEALSSTAQLLSSLAQPQPEKAFVRAPQHSPLWNSPQPPDARPLAGLLHEALSHTGLFYESHQAQWLDGARSTAQLMLEPQNRMARRDAGLPPAGTQADNETAEPRTNPPKMSEQLQQLVQQQLNALETRHVLWHGPIWPGQEMQWEIHEHTPHEHNAPARQQQWVTQVQLDLPRLGTLTATLRISDTGIDIKLNTGLAKTRTELIDASAQLVFALTDAGITVLGTRVQMGTTSTEP